MIDCIGIARAVLCAASVLAFCTPLRAAIRLAPVATGLASPIFVGHAGDGSNRLFIVEQRGVIKVLHSGSSTPTVFLDISAKVAFGGEQGLLGLAFHPDYATTGRFFIYYTRAGDGTIVVAERRVSLDPDVARRAETVLLTIPHPVNTNHNGGMLAFGPDRHLYIGVGDGGAGNDPPDNAQNADVLLGKILRIDVDNPDPVAGTLYSAPSGNPFANGGGRAEIFAYGMRNPWRFSFDRVTGVQWVADVGQGAREEVDMPIVAGGNYGWRVYEGSACTNLDPALCVPSQYRFPIFDYLHAGGRCSITGGYVYRGAQGVLPGGTYVFGDFCSGEIFGWDGTAQTVLLDTTQNIASFGEDERGELYVVDLGGTVSRIARVKTRTPCTYAVSPLRATYARGGGAGSITITTASGCPWTATSAASWITLGSARSGRGSATLTYAVAPYSNRLRNRTGTLSVAGSLVMIKQTR